MKNKLLAKQITQDINKTKYPLNLKPGSTIRVSSRQAIGKSAFSIQLINEILDRDVEYNVLHLDLEVSFSTNRKNQLVSFHNLDRYNIVNYHSIFIQEYQGSLPIFIEPIEEEYSVHYLNRIKQVLLDNNSGLKHIIIIDNIALLSEKEIIEHLVPLSRKIKETNSILILISPQVERIDMQDKTCCYKNVHQDIIDNIIDNDILLSRVELTQFINVINTIQGETKVSNIIWDSFKCEFDKDSIRRL